METATNSTPPTKFTPALALAQWEAAGKPPFWVNTIDFACGTTLCAETGTVIFEPTGVDIATHALDWSSAVWG